MRCTDSRRHTLAEIRRLRAMDDLEAAKSSSAIAEAELHMDRRKTIRESIARLEKRLKRLRRAAKGATE